MLFILITFFAAFLIEGLGTLVSVIGLSSLFGSNLIIMALVIALDIGKIVTVSLLYTYHHEMGRTMKVYAFTAAFITMLITSAGSAGYLSSEFQKAILGTQEVGLKVSVLKDQQKKYEERKKQIDDQIAGLPEKTSVNQRLRMVNGFKAEQGELQRKIAEIDEKLPELQIGQIGAEAKAGPILFLAKAFDIPVQTAISYVIVMIIFVFDPLAVFLIISGNFLLARRRSLAAGPVDPEPEFQIDEKVLAPIELESSSASVAAAVPEEPKTIEPIEPIALEEPVQPATPGEAEAVSGHDREEITMSDLKLYRSSLTDIKDIDDAISYTPGARSAAEKFYQNY